MVEITAKQLSPPFQENPFSLLSFLCHFLAFAAMYHVSLIQIIHVQKFRLVNRSHTVWIQRLF